MTIPLTAGLNNPGWTCPKCGRVYAPWVYTCSACVPATNVTYPGTIVPYVPPGSSGSVSP